MTALIAVMFVFNACNDDSTGPSETKKPGAPVSLVATSTNSTTVTIKWSAPGDLESDLFKEYTVTYYPENTGATNAPDTTVVTANTPVEITGLDENKVYVFAVTTSYTNGETSTATTIKWAPAMRFETVDANTIKIYTSEVLTQGSGINLYADDGLGTFLPTVLSVTNITQWNLGLDTKVAGKVNFGSASALSYSGSSTVINSAEISSSLRVADGLNDPDVFDSQALDSKTYSQRAEDLSKINLTNKGGVVMYARVANGTDYNYAKIFIKSVNGSFLQGTADKYIEITVSYQANAGFPYAKK